MPKPQNKSSTDAGITMTSFRRTPRKKSPGHKKSGSAGHRKILRTAVAASAVLVMALLAKAGQHWMLTADCLSIRHIHISGCSHTSSNGLRSLTGMREGDNIITADLTGASRRLENNAWICRAIIKRKLPDTIDIHIEEHREAAVIKLKEPFLVDSRGDIFKKADRNHAGLPLLTGTDGGNVLPDRQSTGRLIAASLDLISSLKDSGLTGPDGIRIEMDPVFGLTAFTAAGSLRISLGFDMFAEKLARVDMIIDDLAGKGMSARTISINSIGQAYITADTADIKQL